MLVGRIVSLSQKKGYMKFNRQLGKFSILLSLIGLLWPQLVCGAGVTIVTHGFQLDQIDPLDHAHSWVEALGDYVADRAGGTPYIYRLVITSSGTQLTATLTPQNNGLPPITQSANAEIVIKVYWDQTAGVLPPVDTTSIGRIAYQSLTNFNHACELPIQIIGHSRGASVASEMARFLGQQGIWVHQMTTLDPHPWPVTFDASVKIWDTVLFADNYYEDWFETQPNGEPVSGAYNENLTSRLSGGYGDPPGTGDHSDVHLWYHGTVNTSPGASDGSQTFTGTMRNTWYTADEWGGARAGFYYSRLGDGAYALDGFLFGYNDGGHNWFPDSRVSVARIASEWPSFTTLINNASGSVQAGNAFPVEFVYQSYDSGASVAFYLDTDQNPYNGNEIALTLPAINPQPSTGFTTKLTDVNATVPSSTSAGYYYVYGKITNPNGTRYLYARTQVRVLAAGTSAAPTITSVSPSTLPPSSSTQLINIYGSNFKASGDPNASTLIFRDPANTAYVRTPVFVSSSQLQYNITVQSAVGTWSVTVTNAAQSASNLKTFLVQTPPPNTGSLTIYLSPSDAVSAGAQWCVDGGNYRNTGETATGLTPGSHTVSFKSVSGYTTPVDKSISVASGANTTDSGAYTAIVNCSYSLSSYSDTWAAAGGSGAFNVIAPAGCTWTASESLSWVTITSGSSGNGTHGVFYQVDYNASLSPRSGVITAAGQSFTVNQNGNSGACTYTLSAPGTNVPAEGGSNSFSVVAGPSCFWAISRNANWITLLSQQDHTGNDSVQYTVQPYFGSEPRSAEILLSADGGQTFVATFTITQAGTPPPPGTLATGLSYPVSVAVDDSYVYWIEASGKVLKRVSKSGDSPITLATTLSSFGQMVLNGDYLYYLDSGTQVQKLLKSGGTPTPLATGSSFYDGITVQNNTVFWGASGVIYSVPITGGSITSVATSPTSLQDIASIRVTNNVVYWSQTFYPGSLFAQPIGGSRTTLSSGVNVEPGLVIQDGFAYFAGSESIYRVPVDGGARQTLASGRNDAYNLALDTTNIYWVEAGNPIGTNGSVMQMPLAGGAIITLAANLAQPVAIAMDSTNVYWLERNNGQTTRSALKWTAKASTVGDIVPPSISITNPADGAQFNESMISVSGTAADNVSIALVELRLNTGVWQAATGTANWTGSVKLVSGTNTIEGRSQDSAGNYSSGASIVVMYSQPDAKLPQAIDFGQLSKQVVGDAPFALSATTSSGLPASFSVLSGPVVLSGNIVTITAAGLAVLRASQPGDATYAMAPNVDQVLLIVPGNNVITDAQRLESGMFTMRFYGDTGTNYVVMTSTNLVNWLSIATNQISGLGYFEFTDMSSTNFDRRFYKVDQ